MSVLGTILGAGIASAAIGAGASIYNARTARQHQTQLNDLSFERQKELIDKNNLYNLPTNQMQRLKDAGLNPNLIYGSQGLMPAASVGAPPANNQPIGALGDGAVSSLYGLGSLGLQVAQARKLDADTALVNEKTATERLEQLSKTESTNLTKEQVLSEQLDRQIRSTMSQLEIDKFSFQKLIETANLDLSVKQVESVVSLNSIKVDQIKAMVSNDKVRLELDKILNTAQVSKISIDTSLTATQRDFLESVYNLRVSSEAIDNKIKVNEEKLSRLQVINGKLDGKNKVHELRKNELDIKRLEFENSKLFMYYDKYLDTLDSFSGIIKSVK